MTNEDTGKVETSGVWKITEMSDGIFCFNIPGRTKLNPEYGIKNNYRLNISI